MLILGHNQYGESRECDEEHIRRHPLVDLAGEQSRGRSDQSGIDQRRSQSAQASFRRWDWLHHFVDTPEMSASQEGYHNQLEARLRQLPTTHDTLFVLGFRAFAFALMTKASLAWLVNAEVRRQLSDLKGYCKYSLQIPNNVRMPADFSSTWVARRYCDRRDDKPNANRPLNWTFSLRIDRGRMYVEGDASAVYRCLVYLSEGIQPRIHPTDESREDCQDIRMSRITAKWAGNGKTVRRFSVFSQFRQRRFSSI